MKIEISIIIPIYNKERYLNNLFNDLKKQSFKKFECILVNDGSLDNSGKICDEVATLDERFKVIHLDNGGVSNARNIGINYASGRYITFIDADDRIHIHYLENLYECIEKSKADLVISGFEKFWENSNAIEPVEFFLKGLLDIDEVMPQFAIIQKQTGLFGYCWAKIFKKSLITEVKFDTKLALAEDFDFYLKIYPQIRYIYFDTKCYYKYLQMADNSSLIVSDGDIDYYSQFILNLRYREFLKKMGVYEEANKVIVDGQIYNYIFFTIFHSPMKDIRQRVEKMLKIVEKEGFEVKAKGGDLLQKWVIKLFINGNVGLIKGTLFIYRFVRCMIRGKNFKSIFGEN